MSLRPKYYIKQKKVIVRSDFSFFDLSDLRLDDGFYEYFDMPWVYEDEDELFDDFEQEYDECNNSGE